MIVAKECSLFYQDSNSNKEYHLRIEKQGSGYKVIAQFGPRHGTLTYVEKTKGKTVSWWAATEMFDKTEREKRRKGYKNIKSYTSLINVLKKKSGITWIGVSSWEDIAKAATEYFEGQ